MKTFKKIWNKIGYGMTMFVIWAITLVFISFILVGCGSKEVEKTNKNVPKKLVIETEREKDGIVKVVSEDEDEVFSYKGKMTIQENQLSTVVTIIIPNDESIIEESK